MNQATEEKKMFLYFPVYKSLRLSSAQKQNNGNKTANYKVWRWMIFIFCSKVLLKFYHEPDLL